VKIFKAKDSSERRMRFRSSVKLVRAAVLLVLATTANAQSPVPDTNVRATPASSSPVLKICEPDIHASCPGDKNGRELMRCLRSNTDKLSPACRDALPKKKIPANPSP
jgi:hypothetical protein